MSAETVPHPADDPGQVDGQPIPCRVHPEPDLWHPDRGGRSNRNSGVRAVRWLCGQCPVRDACLTWAIDTGQQHGIWGGHGEHSRARIRRERQAAASSPAA